MEVKISSREYAEVLRDEGRLSRFAVISFYDPPSRRTGEVFSPLDYQGRAARVFPVALYDIDLERLEEYGFLYNTYFPEARELARFIKRAHNDGIDILCQGECGQSRSAACAAAIKEHYFKKGITVFADFRYHPNQLVYHKVKYALKREDKA